MKILIAEDHLILASQLQKMLVKQKFSVDVVSDGETANNYLDSISYDLLLLDIGLPKIDGITLCENLRSQGKSIPILMLTGRNTIQDKLRGLNAGGDDYLTKPFNADELIARVHSLLRRRQLEVQPILHWGNLSLNQNLNQIYYENVPLNLTATEHRILSLLLLNPHQVFSRQILIDRIWASTREIPSDDTVKSHIKTIRRKLKDFKLGNLVKTVYGLGYCLDTEFRDVLVQLSSPPTGVKESHQMERVVFKKSIAVYDENCLWDNKIISFLNSNPLAVNSRSNTYFDVSAVRISSALSLIDYLKCQTPDLLLILCDSSDNYQKIFEVLKVINSKNIPINWFPITKMQLSHLTTVLGQHRSLRKESENLLPYQYFQNISNLLETSHAESYRKIQIFIFSTSCSLIETIEIFSENNNYAVTVINTFEEIWNIHNFVIPTVLIMDAEFGDSNSIHLCHLLRSNSYFNHVPIAMIGNGNPYILDEIMEAGIDYFIDRDKIVSQFQFFSAWLSRKSHQYRD